MNAGAVPSKVVVSNAREAKQQALDLLKQNARNIVLYHARPDVTINKILERVDVIFCDLDGTMIGEGSLQFSSRTLSYLQRLKRAGIAIVFVSGRPHQEIIPLMKTLPAGLAVKVIYEKGAYQLLSKNAVYKQKFLLGNADIERRVSVVRGRFVEWQRSIEKKFKTHRLYFGWAGTGMQKSMLSIDVYADSVPRNYLSLAGPARNILKLKDDTLLAQIAAELESFIRVHCPDWQLITLGNGNFEIAPPGLEKDRAIQQTPEFQRAKGVLVLGDSGNDRQMFTLKDETKTCAGLVLHNSAVASLISEVDFVTFGTANPYPLFDILLAAI